MAEEKKEELYCRLLTLDKKQIGRLYVFMEDKIIKNLIIQSSEEGNDLACDDNK